MEKWTTKALSLGSIRQGKNIDFSYFSTEPLKIKSIKPSCEACTEIIGYNPENRTLKIQFRAGAFPQHLILEGRDWMDVNKQIDVTYEDDSTDELYFRVRVYK